MYDGSLIQRAHLWAATALLLLLPLSLAGASQQPDWQAQIRQRLAANDLPGALIIAERRVFEAPQDAAARGWRARLLAWSGRWAEAEAEYRTALDLSPRDADLLLGLADVLAWQQRFQEALEVLDRARQIPPPRAETYVRRGRALRLLGRTDAARAAFREALALEPANAEARAALDGLEDAPRHELRIGGDFDFFNYTDTAEAVGLSLRSQLSSAWAVRLAATRYERFGQRAGKFAASASYRLGANETITAGGAAASFQAVIPQGEAFFEYGRGIRVRRGILRGLELSYGQQWLWFRDARVLVLTPRAIFYLPRDWTWTLQVSAARTRFPATPAEWRPSGLSRLSFPVQRRVTANLLFAVGTENFAQADQVGRFSARTWGGGARVRLAARHDLSFYALRQHRSQQRTQTSFGVSYGIRF